MSDWVQILGCEPREYCDRLYERRPGWVSGTISPQDARFLFSTALEARSDILVEIGTASGFSTAVLAHAAHLTSGGNGSPQVRSYDLNTRFYADPTRPTGEAAREMLLPEILERVTFHHPAFAWTVREHYAPGEVGFAFIDASHRHPWPVLDFV